jgi:hypothetical protein
VDVENVSNDSTVETLWALEPKKRLKRPDGGLGVLFTGTETYAVKIAYLGRVHRDFYSFQMVL